MANIPTPEENDETEYLYDSLATEQDLLQDEAICPQSPKSFTIINKWINIQWKTSKNLQQTIIKSN